MPFSSEKNPFSTPPKTGPKISVQSVAKTPCNHSLKPASHALISSPFVTISTSTAISATMAAITSTTGLAAKKDRAVDMPEMMPAIGEMTAISPTITPIAVCTAGSRFANHCIRAASFSVIVVTSGSTTSARLAMAS